MHLRSGKETLYVDFIFVGEDFNSIIVEDRTVAVKNFTTRRYNDKRLQVRIVSQSIGTLFGASGCVRQRAGTSLPVSVYDGSDTFDSLKMLLQDSRR